MQWGKKSDHNYNMGPGKEIEKLEACTSRLIKYPRSTELESCDQGQEEDTCLEL